METIESVQNALSEKLSKGLVPSRILLQDLRFLDETARQTSAYSDPNYTSFYYHLGSVLHPKTLAEFGLNIGLFSTCFLKGCKSVQLFFAYQPDEGKYLFRVAKSNLRTAYRGDFKFHHGVIHDDLFVREYKKQGFDCVLISQQADYDTYREYCDFIWDNLNLGGIIIMDGVGTRQDNKTAFYDFCRIQNREACIFPTRYGTGLIQK